MRMIPTLALVLFVLISTTTSAQDGIVSYEIGYDFYDSHGEDVVKTERMVRMNPRFIFPVIPGRIFGNPSRPILHVTEATRHKTLVLELPHNADKIAQPFNERRLEASAPGLRMLRLGTFHAATGEDKLGGGGFVSRQSQQHVILVYVSQATRITGNLAIGDSDHHHMLDFKHKGWHWIEMKKLSETEYHLVNFDRPLSDIEFSIPVPKVEPI